MGFVLEKFNHDDECLILGLCSKVDATSITRREFYKLHRDLTKAVEVGGKGCFMVLAPKPSVMEANPYYFFVVDEQLYKLRSSGSGVKLIEFVGSDVQDELKMKLIKDRIREAFFVYGVFDGEYAPLTVKFLGER